MDDGIGAGRNADQRREGDAEAGFDLTEDFARFDQRDDAFTRAFWDDEVRSAKTDAFFASYRVAPTARRAEGFRPRDFALRNAAWLVSDMVTDRRAAEGRREGFQALISLDFPQAPPPEDPTDPEALTGDVARAARFLGADLFGVTEVDERWHYAARVDARDASAAPPEDLGGATHVIVLGHQMDPDLVAAYPSALAGAATGREYSREAAIALQLAAFLRGLGYAAHPSMNDTALAIPYAVKAGLGEDARNQMVITPEFGPRVRFSKIFTDAPLIINAPRRPGVAAFCDICDRCAKACPAKALPFGPPEAAAPGDRSAIKGVVKWTSDAVACFKYWAAIATDCAICMRVCPFNRDFARPADRLWLRLALSPLRRVALWLDDRSGRAGRAKPEAWWRGRKS